MEFAYKPDGARVPIKSWIPKEEYFEDAALMEQTERLAHLPFASNHVVLCPDAHLGYGMPIGAILATSNVIIPYAVGLDIGCGMCYCQTDLHVDSLEIDASGNGTILQAIMGDIMRSIPLGEGKYRKKPQINGWDFVPDHPVSDITDHLTTSDQIERYAGTYNTLGGGNHFIELQRDEEGRVGVMIHSGSRSFGAEVCKAFHHAAKEINERYFSEVPVSWNLAFLPLNDQLGQAYVEWMKAACEFARSNRLAMMETVQNIIMSWVYKGTGWAPGCEDPIDIHHNYAAIENHGNRNVWVHRKGAILAREGIVGIIPGAMGSKSYLVQGLGAEESLHSSSHGAGRRMSRRKAREAFSVQEVIEDSGEFHLAKAKKADVAEEYRGAYKDIDMVMNRQEDLTLATKTLRTVAVAKG